MTFLAFLALDLGRTLRHLWRLLPHLSFLNLVFSLPFAWISFDYYIVVLQWRSRHLHNIAKSESAVSLRKSSLPTSIETTSSSSAKLVTRFFVGDGSSPSPVLSFSLLGFVGFVPNFVVYFRQSYVRFSSLLTVVKDVIVLFALHPTKLGQFLNVNYKVNDSLHVIRNGRLFYL